MNRLVSSIAFTFILFLCMASLGCTPTSALLEKYQEASYYYDALIALDKDDIKSAQRLLKQAIKKANPFISRIAEEELCKTGERSQQQQFLLNYYKKYQDQQALDYCTQGLYNLEYYQDVIKLTENLDLSECTNETAFYRCASLYKKNDPAFIQDFNTWCVSRPFTQLHYDLYQETPTVNEAASFRSAVYAKNYTKAVNYAQLLLQNSEYQLPQILSDAGKAYLYGSTGYEDNAEYFYQLSMELPEDSVFYAKFYAGRLYSKLNGKNQQSQQMFLEAMDAAVTDANYDNALWYYLNACLSSTIKEAVTATEKYCSTWHDPDYFDDFFETLSVRLLSQHMWADFFRTAYVIEGYASPEISAKYSYISARLVDTGIFKKTGYSKEEINNLYQRSLHSGTNVYYKFMAANMLNLSPEEAEIYIPTERMDYNFVRNEDAENLIYAYMDFGYTDRLLDAANLYADQINMECVQKLAEYLKSLGTDTNDFFTKSLRLASKKGNRSEIPANLELLELMYPRDFSDYVTKTCSEYDIPEYLLYGLMRTESFFDPTVISHAGAKGLCQLMDATAGDVAKKLKYSEYDLNDPATNIRFGGYYISEMLSRLDNSPILALFAYNGGITRVRSWVKNANLEFGTDALPRDLFLESLPFEETRDYGRKVLSAAAMYAYLYYDKTPSQIVQEIMQ